LSAKNNRRGERPGELFGFALVNMGRALKMVTFMPPVPKSLSFRGRFAAIAVISAMGWAGCQSPTASPPSEAEPSADETTATAAAEVDAAQEQARAANRQLELDKQRLQLAAWQHVKAIIGMWDELPPEFFPGLTTLVAQTEELRESIESGETINVGRIDPLALTTNNSAYWRAVMETNPDDPVVEMYEQMLWAARGDFDRAVWLIELNRYGPALPPNVHKVIYSMADEMRRIRGRQSVRRNQLLENVPGDQVAQVVATARAFRPQDADWALMALVLRLQQAGVQLNDLAETPEQVDRVVREFSNDWRLVARSNPMVGAQLSPDPAVREAARELGALLGDFAESRGAFGGRDLERLGAALATTGFYGEALLAKQRAVALRGFAVPSDLQTWWTWLPNLIGAEETAALREASEAGMIRPVTFFPSAAGPEGVSLLPLHPILTDRNLRRLQEVQRRLEMPEQGDAAKASALITLAETLGHLGRWDEARDALAEIPPEYAQAGAPMAVWVSLWSGDVEGIDEKIKAVEPDILVGAPALPALVEAAQGNWEAGAEIFIEAAEILDLTAEYRTYYTLMASAFMRLSQREERADELIKLAQEIGQEHEWVSALAASMAGEESPPSVGDNITEITEAGRVCEQRFYRAFQRDISPVRQRALLEACVATGVVDFVEYTASLLRLREIDPQRWDPQLAPADEPADSEISDDEDDWTSGAEASWSIPS
jgi:hypothetical protein